MLYLYACLCTDVFMYVGVLGFCTYVYTRVKCFLLYLYIYGPVFEYICVCVCVCI